MDCEIIFEVGVTRKLGIDSGVDTFTRWMAHYIAKQMSQGKAKNKRQKDPLLKYIDQARDADQHSIQEILVKKDPHYSVKGIIGNDRFSEDFEITTKEPGNVVINGKMVAMQAVGTSFTAIAVTNRKS
jgi:hypothetical protein